MGWFIPTHGDRASFAADAEVKFSLDHFEKVARDAEEAGFDYALVPTTKDCWDAWIISTYLAARTRKLKMLVALKPGFVHPVALAKMVATFDQIAGGGRCYINLIAGQSAEDARAEGQSESKETRYEQLAEEVMLLKRLTTERSVEFSGKFHQIHHPSILPNMTGCPPFFLGGGSEFAAEISARFSSTHLFWGDFPERIATQIKEMRERAAKYGRENELQFAMRLQIICRETEAEAWDAAHRLVANSEARKARMDANRTGFDSVANARQRELAALKDGKLTTHLWSGISDVRTGSGIAVVGNPDQVAAQLREFVEAGCSGFCLSGFPHDEEASIFGRYVMPLLDRS
ncbi:alkanesulfonate monooxygenase [Variovorax sp. WS11]|uniref:LLM class flavin-dependent oxidoreductase n=1 Tax=Variovorax sp. WS11 TaxID=1105204 RepID=UPI000D0D3284|nr:LLM class flavin-dependent oxidoreductase [Variovorax sp. WS11]NDZ18061.1 LLM class flavin-dependent oxidoreductase [Variovorax sp. WS11]PSL80007.1 alkanesulfonate monooxygenase [Variovorax sp. WS11]